MADPAPCPVKRCLGNVAMHVDCVRKRRDKTYSVLRWKIEKFLMLKDTVRYKWKVETPDWILKLDKKRYSITVTIESENYYPSIIGYISYESLKFSEPVTFEQVFRGVYKAQFGPKLVNNKHNEILKKHGRLELCFAFGIKWNLSTQARPCYGTKSVADENNLSGDVSKSLFCLRSFAEILLSDFEIHLKKETYYVHKAILQARSTFFKLYIDQCCEDGKIGEISIRKTMPEAMNIVLYYIYSGKMIIPNNVDLRIWTFMLADFFQITSLRRAYIDLLLRNMDKTNVVRMKNAGMSTGTRLLIEAADAYLSEYGSSISEEDECTETSKHSTVISIL